MKYNDLIFFRLNRWSQRLGLLPSLLTLVLALFLGPVASAAPITVSTTNDVIDANSGTCVGMTIANLPGPDGVISLREAICATNTGAGGDIITLPAGTYKLSITGQENVNVSGDLDILQNVTINGAGATTTIIESNVNDRTLDIGPATNPTVLINNVTISNLITLGTLNGSGIQKAGTGTLTLTNCIVSGNTNTSQGAGIYLNNGTLTLDYCTVSSNSASGTTGKGGGINVAGGTLNVINSTINSNTAGVTTGTNSGGGVRQAAGSTTFTNSIIIANIATVGNADCQFTNAPTSYTNNLWDTTKGCPANGGANTGNIAITTLPTIALSAGSGQTTSAGSAFSTQLQVLVQQGGSPLSNASVVFTPPSSGVSATCTSPVLTNASGIASSTCTANGTVGGPYTVVASIGNERQSFSLTNTTPAAPEIDVLDDATTPNNLADGTATVDLGSHLVGTANVTKTFTVKNTGTADLTLPSPVTFSGSPSKFSVTSSFGTTPVTVSAGTFVTFTVKLDTTAVGTFSETLSFANNDSNENPFDFTITGTVTAAPEIDVLDDATTPNNLADGIATVVDFGSGTVGSSLTKTFTVKNTGTADLTLTSPVTFSGGATSKFSVTSTFGTPTVTVTAGNSVAFTVKLDTTTVGTFSETLSFANNDSNENPFDFTIKGTVTAPEIDVLDDATTPNNLADGTATVDLGSHLVGTANVTKTFTVKNTGTADLTLTSPVTFSGGATSKFSVTSTFGTPTVTVSAGTSVTFTVKLDTTAVGTFSETLSFANNDSNENPFDFTIKGAVTSTPVPEIQVLDGSTDIADGTGTTNAIDIGTTTQGTAISKTFTIKNIGNAILNLSNLTLGGTALPTGGFSLVGTFPGSVAANSTATFVVRLDATTAGNYSGILQFTNDDSNENPFDFAIKGTVNAPEIEVFDGTTNLVDGTTTALDFGSTLQGTSIDKTFTIKNSGNAILNLSNLTLGGTALPTGGFSLVGTFPSSVAVNSTATFVVRLDATTAGNYGGTLQFTNDDSNENPFDFAIKGTVTLPAPEIEVFDGTVNISDGTTTAVDFGSGTVGSSLTKIFTVKNIGTADLSLTSVVSFSGGATSKFSVTSTFGTPTVTVTAGNSVAFTVKLDTTTVGTFSETLSFANNDSNENPFDFTITGAVTSTPVPEIQVLDGSTDIADGTGTTNAIDIGTTTQGTAISKTFTIKNIGSATLNLSNLTLGGTALPTGGFSLVGTFPSSVAANNGTATFTVRLDAITAGNYGGTLQFTNDDSNENPFDFAIKGTVNPPLAPEIQVIGGTTDITSGTTTIDFGSTTVGTAVTKTFTVNNIGTANLTLTAPISITGTDATKFSVSQSFGSTTLTTTAPNNTTTFKVTLVASSAGGPFNATLSFTNDDSDEGNFNFPIKGTVTVAGTTGGNNSGGNNTTGGTTGNSNPSTTPTTTPVNYPPSPSTPPTEASLAFAADGPGKLGSQVTVTPAPKRTCQRDDGLTCYVYDLSTQVTITAIPAPNAFFNAWSGASECKSPTNVIVTSMANSKLCLAFFHLKPHQLTLTQTGTGHGNISTDLPGQTNLTGGDAKCNNNCYEGGTQVTLRATPTADSTFTGWSGDDDCKDGKITMDNDKNCVATFTLLPTYTLTTTKTGNGTGTLTTDLPGTNCGPDCARYLSGAQVTLTATPAPGSTLAGWTGDCTDGHILVNADKKCSAIFTLIPTFTLTVTPSGTGKGTVSNNPTGTSCGTQCMSYVSGTSVTLTATPEPGTTFTSWGGDCTNGQVILNQHKLCTAIFTAAGTVPPVTPPQPPVTPPPTPVTHTLTVTQTGTGTGEVTYSTPGTPCGNTCNSYPTGTQVTLTTKPATNSTFAGWSGDCNTTTGQVTLDADKRCTATFNLLPTLTITLAGSGNGRVTSTPAGIDCGTTCTNSYQPGSTVTLTAIAETGSKVLGWSGDSDCNTGKVTIDKTKHCVAIFERFSRLQFAKDKYEVHEDEGTATLTVNRVGSSAKGVVSVIYTTADGTALANQDYTPATGKLTWTDGDNADKTITVTVLPHKEQNANKTVTVKLVSTEGDASLGTPQNAELTIIDVPWFVSLQFATASYTVSETEGKVSLLVTRAGSPLGDLAITYATTDGTAIANQDYTPTTGTVTWANGDRTHKVITVPLVNNPQATGNRNFLVTLSNPTNGAQLGQPTQATTTILKVAQSPTTGSPTTGTQPTGTTGNGTTVPTPPTTPTPVGNLQFVVANSQVNEDNGSLTVTVIRSGGHQGAVTVTYATQDDTAKVNQDYQPATGTLRWADGEAGPKQFIVGLLDDTLVEDLKTFHITLTNPTGGAQLGQVATTVVTINDNDVATLQFSLSNYMVAKNSPEALITVTRVGSNVGDLTVTYDTVDDTAKAGQDYTAQSGTLTWSNGDSTAKTFAVPLLYGTTATGGSNKTFQVQLASATGKAALGTPKEATVTIAEDDHSGCQLAPVIDCYLNNATNVVPVKDIKITTRGTVVGGILGGTIQNAGTIQDVTLLTNTVIYGGTVGGTLKGTALPDRPDFNEILATLSEVKILPKSNLQQVIIGRGCVLDNTVILGAGVLFEDNSTIPYGIDLSQAYSHTVIPITPVFGQRGIWLGEDVLRYSAIGGMLGAINSLYALTSQNLVLTQHPRYGYLTVNVNQVRYAVLPLRLRQIINTQRSEEQTPEGMTLSPEGTVTFVTHTGREVTAYPVIQNPDALQEALRNWGLTVDMQDDGNLKVPTTNGTYYIARPSIYSTPVSKDVPVGLTVTPPVSLIFDDDTETRRQQLIYPAAANPDALREADNNTVLGNDGRLTLRVGNRFYQGMLDYLVTSGTRTSDGQLQVLDVGDVNEDGLTDYQIIYPNGVKQMMFGM